MRAVNPLVERSPEATPARMVAARVRVVIPALYHGFDWFPVKPLGSVTPGAEGRFRWSVFGYAPRVQRDVAYDALPGLPGIEDLRPVGRGGFATVYRAWQPAFHRPVAVKILDLTSGDPLSRFRKEVGAMGALSGHPHVVPIYDAGVVGNRPYLVMPYLSGGSLGDRMTQGRLSADEVISAGVAMASALAAAHEHGLLHRDVKPGNILIDDYGQARLTDFGVARFFDATVTRGELSATVAYAAPEVLSGEPASPQSDIYSLGATLYAALTGAPPFTAREGESVIGFAMRTVREQPPSLDGLGLPAGLVRAVERAMAKEPAARYRSAADFGTALSAVRALPSPPVAPTLGTRPADVGAAARPAGAGIAGAGTAGAGTAGAGTAGAALAGAVGGRAEAEAGRNGGEATPPGLGQPRPASARLAPVAPSRMADRREARQGYGQGHGRGRRGAFVVAALALILLTAGVATALALRNGGSPHRAAGSAGFHSSASTVKSASSSTSPSAPSTTTAPATSSSTTAATTAPTSAATVAPTTAASANTGGPGANPSPSSAVPGGSANSTSATSPSANEIVSTVDQYYALVNRHQLSQSFGWLSPAYQERIGYAYYQQFWNGIRQVQVTNVVPGANQATITLHYMETNGTSSTERATVTFIPGSKPGSLLIDTYQVG
jgi:hypothetical protein